MRKNNIRVTRPDQARAEAAAKRRAKRKQVRTALLAPYRKLLVARDEQISKLITEVQELSSENQKLRLPVTEGK